jgi:hypothetical protein
MNFTIRSNCSRALRMACSFDIMMKGLLASP